MAHPKANTNRRSRATTSPTWEDIDWYETPRYYDAIFDVDTDREADFLEAAFERHASPSARGRRRLLEPASGSGRLLVEMAARGWKVHGFDLEPAMVEYSRQRLASAGLPGTVARGDMANFRARGTFDLAHCLVSTFKYLQTEDAARAHLACVANHVRTGGIYALGFHLSDYSSTKKEIERWRVERDGMQVDCSIASWPPDRRTRLEDVESRISVKEGGRERRSVTRWTFRTYDARQVRSLLRASPLWKHVATYDFHYEIDEPQPFGDTQCDTLLILERQ